ncbi:MAG: hypothetical protein CVU84_05245 [Firmicutes bacterium HGW-Firmicutes-1]|jgi:hypothetical protein|nr:MAG: hypothetical protein CVU84_05245 [Firmicutes bacterium HGW-Firmicutes-1]
MKKLIVSILLCAFIVVGCRSNDIKEKVNVDEQKNEDTSSEDEVKEDEVIEEGEDSEEGTKEEENVLYYIDKLKDKKFVSTYGDEQEPSVWYTAAEELGTIGKPSIPYLIENLETTDTYEKGLTLYALLLASQDESLREITNGEYIEAGLTFNEKEQAEFTEVALKWWDKYKDKF